MVKNNRGKTKSAAPAASAKPAGRDRRRFGRYCLTLLVLGAAVLAWLSLLSFSPGDPPSRMVYPPHSPVANRAGLVGSYTAYTLRYWVGAGSYAALGLLTLWSFLGLIGRGVGDLPWRLVGLVLLTSACSAAANMLNPGFSGELIEGSAGVLGTAAGQFLVMKFGQAGSWIILLTGGIIGLMFSADHLLKAGAHRIWHRRSDMVKKFAALRARKLAAASAGASGGALPPPTAADFSQKKIDRAKAPGLTPPARPAKESAESNTARPRVTLTPRRPDRPKSPTDVKASKARAISLSASGRGDNFELPSMDLLVEPQGGYNETAEIQAVQRKLVLQQTLDDFGVEAKIVGYMTGPVITLFEVSLSPGVKVAQVANLATDIARALAVSGVRVVPPRFGKDTVGIEVPNLDKEIVRLKELMSMQPQARDKMSLPLYMGKDAGGDAIVADLGSMPHMLIAGTTGSGKSVCLNSIIMSILMTRSPWEVRFIMVDPKMVELAAFERLPHLLCPIVNDMRKAEDILEWATAKMDERYELLREAGVRNLTAYNRLGKKEKFERLGAETSEEQARIPLQIPAYIIIIDELADLMMTSCKEVEAYIIRIAQKARAVGIHLVLATQRPSANVVTGLIKSNMPCRVSFRVASGQESRIVLDQKGAEILLGQGDMLLLQPGDSNLIRAQGTFVDDTEIRAVAKALNATDGQQEFDTELMQLQNGGGGQLGEDRDEMFDQAVDIVLASKRGSVSLLQRRMQIGYGRASRIIDQMGLAGILGEHKGSQARECMITLDDWEQMKASIAADQSGASSFDGEPTSS